MSSCSVIPSLAFIALVAGGLPAFAQTVHVPQGAVARWSADGTETCGMDGRSWKALEGTCWYPVDFERAPGKVEIARWRSGGDIEKAWLVVEAKEFETQEIEFPDDAYVHLSEENLARLYQEQAEIKPIFRRRSGDARFTLPLGKPAEPLPEGLYFGVPRKFNGEAKSPHTGADYAIGLGNSVKAVADGTVVLTGEHFFAGNSVYLYHGAGLVSMYFHLSEIKVEKGQEVKRGDEIALVGSTGRSTGPHLHLGVRWHGARIDPNLLIVSLDQAPQVGSESSAEAAPGT